MAPAVTAEDLPNGTGEVQIDHVKSGRGQLLCRQRERLCRRSHQLGPTGVLLVRYADEAPRLAAFADAQDELIQQHLAHSVRRPQPPRNHTHRPIAVSAQRGLDDREIDPYRPDVELRELLVHRLEVMASTDWVLRGRRARPRRWAAGALRRTRTGSPRLRTPCCTGHLRCRRPCAA